MSSADLKKLVADVYEEESVSSSRMAAIMADTGQVTRYHVRRVTGYLSMAAAVSFLVVFSVDSYRKSTIRETVLQDLATGHQSNLAVEVEARDCDELTQKMKRVNFPIKPQAEPVEQIYQVKGARYNTVGGELAAQVAIKNRMSNRNGTMYTARLTKRLSAVKPAFYRKDGVRIKVWQDNNMFYAIAR